MSAIKVFAYYGIVDKDGNGIEETGELGQATIGIGTYGVDNSAWIRIGDTDSQDLLEHEKLQREQFAPLQYGNEGTFYLLFILLLFVLYFLIE